MDILTIQSIVLFFAAIVIFALIRDGIKLQRKNGKILSDQFEQSREIMRMTKAVNFMKHEVNTTLWALESILDMFVNVLDENAVLQKEVEQLRKKKKSK